MVRCCLLNYVPYVVDIDDFSSIFGKNYKYYLCIVVNCPSKRKTRAAEKPKIRKKEILEIIGRYYDLSPESYDIKIVLKSKKRAAND